MVYTEDTPLNCRVPWAELSQYAFAFSARVPVPDLSTGIRNPYRFPFHGLQESAELRIHGALPCSPASPRYKTPLGFMANLRRLIQKRQKPVLALPHVSLWRRNINLLPIPQSRLRYGLGPANCQLMTIAGKPALFRRLGFSPS